MIGIIATVLGLVLIVGMQYLITLTTKISADDGRKFDFGKLLSELGETSTFVEFAHLVPEEWDEMILITPEMDVAAEERRLGVELPARVRTMSKKARARCTVFVFAYNRKYLRWAEVPQEQVLVQSDGSSSPFEREPCRVKIERVEGFTQFVAQFSTKWQKSAP